MHKRLLFALALIASPALAQIGAQADDAIAWCRPADADQHRLCQMKLAGSFLGMSAQLRFVEFDLLANRRVAVIYAFPLTRKPALERAIRAHLPSAQERLNPWGHAEGTRVWTTSDKRFTLEADNGKMSVRVETRG